MCWKFHHASFQQVTIEGRVLQGASANVQRSLNRLVMYSQAGFLICLVSCRPAALCGVPHRRGQPNYERNCPACLPQL